jgi:hypothetical protein
MRYCILLLSFGLFVAASCANVGVPEPQRSEYVISTGAGFAMTPERGVYYGMTFEFRRAFANPIFVVALFENPADSLSPLRVEKTVDAETLDFTIQSPQLKVLKNNKRYIVELSLYQDDAHTQLIGQHRQEVLFSVPREYKPRLEQQFSIRIL